MRNDSPIVFVMVGLPGSGKTSTRSLLNAKLFVSSDWHIEQIALKEGKTYNEVFPTAVKVAAKELQKDVDFVLGLNASFIWDQTNLTVKKRAEILKRIPGNYIKVAVFNNTPLDICIERNNKRDRSIPENVIVNMSKSLQPPTIEEGFDHIIEIDVDGKLSYRSKDVRCDADSSSISNSLVC